MSKNKEKLPPIGTFVQWKSDGKIAIVINHENCFTASLISCDGNNFEWGYDLPQPAIVGEPNCYNWQTFKGKR